MKRLPLALVCILLAFSPAPAAEEAAEPLKIILVAGEKSHGPEGNGIHDYPRSVRLLEALLKTAPNIQPVEVHSFFNGFPKDLSAFEDADSIVVISDGRDGDKYSEAPFMASEVNWKTVMREVDKGCGLVTFHFSTFANDHYGERLLGITGGYFDWQDDTGARNWHSAIRHLDTAVAPATPGHPVNNGVKPLKLKEEYYYNIRFPKDRKHWIPIWRAPELASEERPLGDIVAWAVEQPGGGRGFGTTLGHYYDSWQRDDFRKMILNAIVWTSNGAVPPEGVSSTFLTDEEIEGVRARE